MGSWILLTVGRKSIFEFSLSSRNYSEERDVRMKREYSEIVRHIPSLEDHGRLYMYYGTPYSEECYIYCNKEDNNLIVSYECDDLCRSIADKFQYDYEWLDILDENEIVFEKIFDIDVEAQDF